MFNLIKGDFDAVRLDKEPYEGGIVHKGSAVEIDIFPFFQDLYATEAQLREFVGWCERHDNTATKADCAQQSDVSRVELEKMLDQLKGDNSAGRIVDCLTELGELKVTVQLLLETKAPKFILQFGKVAEGRVAAAAKKLYKGWKTQVEATLIRGGEGGGLSRSQVYSNEISAAVVASSGATVGAAAEDSVCDFASQVSQSSKRARHSD